MKRSLGFTLVEVLVVSPLFILLIGTMIFAAVSLTGLSIQTNEKNAMMAETQTAFDAIENEVSRGNAFLQTTGAVTAPQGSDDSSGAAFTAATAGPIIIQSTATTRSPLDSTRELVYSNSPDSSCNSSTVSSNTPYPVTYVYFVKSGVLWKRTILGSQSITGTCSTPYQKPSCEVGYSASYCKAEDEEIMDNVTSMEALYYAGSSGGTAQPSPTGAKTLKLSIVTTKTTAGTPLTSTSSTTINLASVPVAISGNVSTLAGSGSSGFSNGTGTAATFYGPRGIDADSSGNIYVADLNNNAIRKITPTGVVTTFASANYPIDVAIAQNGDVYATELYNGRILKFTPSGSASVYVSGLSYPACLAFSPNGELYYTSHNNHSINKINSTGSPVYIAGGSQGSANGSYTGASFNYPYDMVINTSGDIYVTDMGNNRIRKLSNGVVSTFVGGSQGYADGSGTSAMFYYPYGIVADSQGNFYVSEQNNNRVRKVTPNGTVTTVAGGSQGYADGTGASAMFNSPNSIVMYNNSLFLADYSNQRIRKIQ